jgi:hypothetical protein
MRHFGTVHMQSLAKGVRIGLTAFNPITSFEDPIGLHMIRHGGRAGLAVAFIASLSDRIINAALKRKPVKEVMDV